MCRYRLLLHFEYYITFRIKAVVISFTAAKAVVASQYEFFGYFWDTRAQV